MFDTPLTHNIHDEIATQGYSIVPPDEITPFAAFPLAWRQLQADYAQLPPDNHLPNNATYRFRRYDSFYFLPFSGELALLPHQDYYQSEDINRVTGGQIRRFAPLTAETSDNPFLHELIRWDFQQFPLRTTEQQYHPWQVDVHEILVVAEPGSSGHPTPEGIHRDGAEFVTVHLATIDNAAGGLVSVYDEQQQPLASFQLQRVMESYLFDDARLWHGVTPIEPADGHSAARRGILTFDYHYRPDRF